MKRVEQKIQSTRGTVVIGSGHPKFDRILAGAESAEAQDLELAAAVQNARDNGVGVVSAAQTISGGRFVGLIEPYPRRVPAMVNMSTFFQYPNLEPEGEGRKFMADFSEKDLQKIYAIGEVQHFAAGEIVVTETADDTALFIILEGTAEVLIPERNGWYKLASLSPSGVFGELLFFDRLPRSARVVALTDCSALLPQTWAQEKRIDALLGSAAVSIDPQRRVVATD